jgi:O-methyltransferase domain
MTLQDSHSITDSALYEQMLSMVLGSWVTQTVRAVADLSLADHLAEGNMTANEVAEREGSAPDTTLRLMRAGVSTGLLESVGDQRFRGTPLLKTLRKDDPRTLRPLALAMTRRSHWLPWSEFVAGIRKGETQVFKALGTDLFEYLENNPVEAQEFSAAMRSLTTLWGPSIAAAIDTTGVRCAVDVGGANGSLLHLLLAANPRLRGIVFDRANVAEHAKAELARSGFAGRAEVMGGDFFKSVPAGDLYLLKFILHDWNDEECVTILRRCREAMAPGGRVAILELVVGQDNPIAALWDMQMLAECTGRERSVEEHEALLAAAGLRLTSVHKTGTPQFVIEAVSQE